MKNITILIIILIDIQSSIAVSACEEYIDNEWPDSRYTINTISGDNVVTDNITGLMWKQCSEGLVGANCDLGLLSTYTWLQALDLAETTEFSDFTDWRLPNIEELRSIAAINCFNPTINESAFPNTPSNSFWSSTPFDSVDSWVLQFYNGDDAKFFKDYDGLYVRLVRSGQ